MSPSYWFTSDLHFGHTNVIKYAKRPFLNAAGEPDARLMNEALIANWNARVKPGDSIYVIGDFACGCPPHVPTEIVQRLNGEKYLVFGNHDKSRRREQEFLQHFMWARDLAQVQVPVGGRNQTIVLCHYAMRVWNKSHYGTWHLYGHSHGSLPDDPHALSLDVGVDCWNYAPVSVEEIAARMAQKTFVPIDHHGRDKKIP